MQFERVFRPKMSRNRYNVNGSGSTIIINGGSSEGGSSQHIDTLPYDKHISNKDIHVDGVDKKKWNNHIANIDLHVSEEDRNYWNMKLDEAIWNRVFVINQSGVHAKVDDLIVNNSYINKEGHAKVKDITLEKVESVGLSKGPLGTGFVLEEDPTTKKSYLEVDNLFVRLKATFTELEIKKLAYSGGNYLFGPAGMNCSSVTEYDGYFRCYFTTKDGDTEVENEFELDDLVRCQEFKIKKGIQSNVSNRFYWMRCVGKGENYIDLSKTDKDSLSNATPREGDALVTVGNKSNIDRQNAIMITAYGEDSPAIYEFQKINDYSLAGKDSTRISPKLGNKFTGDFIMTSGDNVKDYTDNAVGGLQSTVESEFVKTNNQIKSKVSQEDFNALGVRVGKNESSITQTQNEISSKVSQEEFNTLSGTVSTHSSEIKQNADNISLKVSQSDAEQIAQNEANGIKDKLLDTGIDIENKNITVTADKFTVKSNTGQTGVQVFVDEDGVPKLQADYINADGITAKDVNVTGNICTQTLTLTENTANGELNEVLNGSCISDGVTIFPELKPGEVRSIHYFHPCNSRVISIATFKGVNSRVKFALGGNVLSATNTLDLAGYATYTIYGYGELFNGANETVWCVYDYTPKEPTIPDRRLHYRKMTSSGQLRDDDEFVEIRVSNWVDITMPIGAMVGQRIYFKNMSHDIRLIGKFMNPNDEATYDNYNLGRMSMIFIYDGDAWVSFYCG